MITRFRAWSKTEKIMSDVKKIDFWNREIDARCFEETEIEKIELMQSTGLLDKNGQEIFVKDIVDYKGRKAIVKWHGSYASFIYIFVDELQKRVADWKPLYLSYYKFEVIGNRFENPELLEAGHDRN